MSELPDRAGALPVLSAPRACPQKGGAHAVPATDGAGACLRDVESCRPHKPGGLGLLATEQAWS